MFDAKQKMERFYSSRRIYLTASLLLLLVILVDQVVVHSFFIDQQSRATVINLAGRQRMLSQKISKLALLLAHQKANESLIDEIQRLDQQWREVRQALFHGDEAMGIIKVSNAKTDSLFKRINPHQDSISAAVKTIAMLPEDKVYQASVQTILSHEEPFLKGMDQLVNTYEAITQREVVRVRLFFITVGIIIFLSFTFIFYPVHKILFRQNKMIKQSLDEQEAINEEFKASEEELRHSLDALSEANLELQKARKEAEEAGLAKASFLSTMSHEIRTPLNAVIGIAHLMLADEPKTSQNENLKSLMFSAENLLYLINNILDFSKIEAGKIDLESVECSLPDLLYHVIQSFSVPAEEKGIELICEIDDVLSKKSVMLDSNRLTQVLNNLIGNALKFSSKGNIQLSAKIVESVADDCEVLFSVRDTGTGIPEEKFTKVFESFSQADSSTSRNYGGSGLGLSISQRLIHLMGSSINLESKEGEGSCFSFKLKLAVKDSSVRRKISQTYENKDLTLVGKKILVAEDNQMNILVISQFMKKWHAEFTIVKNGLQALEQVKEQAFDIILMDIQMPVMGGIEASRLIRAFDTATPIIALTASTNQEIKEQIGTVGINGFASKPFVPDELYKKMVSLLDRDTQQMSL